MYTKLSFMYIYYINDLIFNLNQYSLHIKRKIYMQIRTPYFGKHFKWKILFLHNSRHRADGRFIALHVDIYKIYRSHEFLRQKEKNLHKTNWLLYIQLVEYSPKRKCTLLLHTLPRQPVFFFVNIFTNLYLRLNIL